MATQQQRRVRNILRPITEEKKSRRLSLFLRPSIYNGLEKIAEGYGLSVNEATNQILGDFVQNYFAEEQDDLGEKS